MESTYDRKYLPYVYTEHGILALAGVIKSDAAAKMSVEIETNKRFDEVI